MPAASSSTDACPACLRRSWLLQALAAHLERASATYGSLDAAFALTDAELIAALTTEGSRRERLLAERERFEPDALLGACAVAGLDAICRHSPGFPTALRDLAGPPRALFVARASALGAMLEEPTVAIVGARRASTYGLETARSLARGLAAAGVTVISGMALGVDSAAHAGALDAAGATLAVLGGGADVAYPAAKRALHARILREACALSELPPGFRPRRWCFPARNRLIAALARLTIVVEAAEHSGSLITARAARELGRDVGAVPGRVTARLSAGSNALIRDGAHLIAGPQDALDVVCGVGVRSALRTPVHRELAPHLRRTLEAVRDGRDTIPALAATREEAQAAMAALAELELMGALKRGPGGRYLALM